MARYRYNTQNPYSQLNYQKQQLEYQRAQEREAYRQQQNRQDSFEQISSQHPDLSDAQVNMVMQGKMGVAPSSQFDSAPEQPVAPPAPAYRIGANSLQNSLARQDHAAALSQKNFITRQMAKLDAKDPDDADKLSTYQDQLDTIDQQLSSNGQNNPTPESQVAVPLGKGTAGQTAPVYQAGGPDVSKTLSNGGSVYFGSVAGAPKFRVASFAQQAGNGTGTVAQPQAQPDVSNAFPGSVDPATLGGVPAPAFTLGNMPATANDGDVPPAPAFSITPNQIKKRVAIAKQLTALGDNAPQPYIDAVNQKLAAYDQSVTNPPAQFSFNQPFSIPGGSASDAMSQLPDSGMPAPATPQGIPVRNKTTGKTGLQMPDGTIIPDAE